MEVTETSGFGSSFCCASFFSASLSILSSCGAPGLTEQSEVDHLSCEVTTAQGICVMAEALCFLNARDVKRAALDVIFGADARVKAAGSECVMVERSMAG